MESYRLLLIVLGLGLTCTWIGLSNGSPVRNDTILEKIGTSQVQQSRDQFAHDSWKSVPFDCTLRASNKSKGHFRHMVYYHDLNLVYLHINTSEDVSIKGDRFVIGPTIWTWTFAGSDGALEFLTWPMEFGIWSMGLLTSYVMDLNVKIERASGDCNNVTVGGNDSNNAIGNALVELVLTLIPISMQTREKYGPSFFCYKRRVYINPSALYALCKHIVCPYEAIDYKCCTYYYDQDKEQRQISCDYPHFFQYDNLWWVGPIFVSFVIFAYTPLLLMNESSRFSMSQRAVSDYLDREKYEEMGESSEFVFFDGEFHITLFNTLLSPVINVIGRYQSKVSRFIRFLLPWLSLSLIGLQLFLDHKFLSGFVLDSVMSGAPMGFRSMLAGYHNSTRNFLPYLGGPYVALGMYLTIGCIFIILPKSLSHHLSLGIPDNQDDPVKSPLMLSLKQKAVLGSVEFHTDAGYSRIYKVGIAQFYMLLNKVYWTDAVGIQIRRWRMWRKSSLCICLFPLYILFCFLEHILCVVFYGLPIALFTVIITRSYYRSIIRIKDSNILGRLSVPCVTVMMIILVVCVAVFMFMFCTIFLDACLFFTRIFIFTYTGIVVYPKFSYGFLIFALTVIYYLWECVKDFSLTYNRILKTTIKVCKKLQRANDTQPNVVRVGLFLGVRESILEHVIERICPRRKQAFLSLLKLTIVLGAIGISLELLTKTDSLRELHVLVHVTTALFTCAVPKIAKSMFGKSESKLGQLIFEDKVRRVVREKIADDDNSVQVDIDFDSE